MRRVFLNLALPLIRAEVWTGKVAGPIEAGFFPRSIRAGFEAAPAGIGMNVSAGISAPGLSLPTLIAKMAILIEPGLVTHRFQTPGLVSGGTPFRSGGGK